MASKQMTFDTIDHRRTTARWSHCRWSATHRNYIIVQPQLTDEVDANRQHTQHEDDVMSIRTVRFSRFMAAACATVITATGAWVFAASSTSTERDPFHFAAVMAANAEVRTAQVQTPNTTPPTCWNESLSGTRPAGSDVPVCRRG
jgi:hypothetical protein